MQRHEMLSGEEGIRTLARFNTSTPLARAPLQPLEYFSITDIIIPAIDDSSKHFRMFGSYKANGWRSDAINVLIGGDMSTIHVRFLWLLHK